MNNLLKEIDEQVQWFCIEYDNYPNTKKEQKKYHAGLSLILIEFSNAIVLWKKQVREFPEKEQTALLDFLTKLGKSFKLVDKALGCPQMQFATLQVVLGEIKSYSERSRAQLTNKDDTLLYLKNQSSSLCPLS